MKMDGWYTFESQRGMPLRDLEGKELADNLTGGMEVLVQHPFAGGFEKGVVCLDSNGKPHYVDTGCNLWLLSYSDNEHDKGWGVRGGINKKAIMRSK